MPGTSDIEENKIFKDIALGTPGKGRYAGKTDWKKYRECPLWDNLEKKKKCPCIDGEPCKDNCTCANPLSSAGCSKCDTYGNPESDTADK